jgi:phosphomannomutase
MLSSGSALVTPDSFEPMFHIYAEGKSVFDCEETVEKVVALIQSILAQTKP